MVSDKLPLFICFTLLLFNLSTTNGSSDDDFVEEIEADKNVNAKGDGSSSRNKWRKKRKTPIDECQTKLFGEKQPIREFYLDQETKNKIMTYYIKNNQNFKEAAERYKELKPQQKQGNLEVSSFFRLGTHSPSTSDGISQIEVTPHS